MKEIKHRERDKMLMLLMELDGWRMRIKPDSVFLKVIVIIWFVCFFIDNILTNWKLIQSTNQLIKSKNYILILKCRGCLCDVSCNSVVNMVVDYNTYSHTISQFIKSPISIPEPDTKFWTCNKVLNQPKCEIMLLKTSQTSA